MEGVYKMGRDNARTPMHWDDKQYAGFTEGTPWLKVNPNYKKINVKAALENKNSIFYTYQKLIELRKTSIYSDTIIYGDYKLLLENDEYVFMYKRFDNDYELLVIGNFTDKEVKININDNIQKLILTNYPDTSLNLKLLRPYESCVFQVNK